ncbi:PLP-dependent aminotransferase family protein [Cryptosporangium aurantiacum]|uniref:DNA-binding transcriptional regulator, MocR family, contains an aminotransferase domain n=1 Tax=Cryptosporangium aurantiacum TaxID=134849 RepID=A0A1M7TTG9_9ACTN|nr:PLP-dependent aminotransferase family protein [Cryptosporangium aurantiacum]SHN74044.1 DNA-binding transcriptional regulator, MocR family, contains an aminotransferase domain [Cryptosporangium aurantiacum]
MYDGSSTAHLVEALRTALNRYSVGEKLPSSRALVRQYEVSPVTVARAIAALVAEGLVTSRPGAGVFKANRAERGVPGDVSWQEVALSADAGARGVDAAGVLATLTAPPAEVVDLNGGYLHTSLQPERALAAALARAGRRPGAWSRPPVEGLPELRSWFARDIGGSLDGGDVLVTAGGQTALTTALRALAVPGAPVLVESPTYPGLLAVARAAGLRPVPVPVDADGVRTDLLADAFAATRARLFVCQPLFQNPTGTVLAPVRRAEVVRIAHTAGAFVVEDDFARRLVHADAPPLPPPLAADDPDGVVVHVRSLTKVTSPSLRIGALTARGPALERLRATQIVDSFFVPRPLQETALELVGSPAWARHLRTLAVALRDRRTALLGALADLRPQWTPYGGYHLWLRLPDGTDEQAVVAAALREGVAVTPGGSYFTAEAPGPYLRLSYVSTAHPEDGGHRLRRALR